MLTRDEIVSTLMPVNGTAFTVADLPAYAEKVLTHGKALFTRDGGRLVAYVLYYDNGPEAFVSMVWTHPDRQGRGLATALLEDLIRIVPKPIRLEVAAANPARHLYAKLGFQTSASSDPRVTMTLGRRVAIMQPYLYPYLGYFHLIHAADLFVFYDDVHFIKKGRIHRNAILVHGAAHTFTVPIADASQHRLICETRLHELGLWRDRFLKQLSHSYGKAPHFAAVRDVVASALTAPESIADLAVASVTGVLGYLGVTKECVRSSSYSPQTRGQEKAERLIAITHQAGGTRYVNAAGGRSLYDKASFAERGVALSFIHSAPVVYPQFAEPFVGYLSILDVLMFNPPERVRELLTDYTLD